MGCCAPLPPNLFGQIVPYVDGRGTEYGECPLSGFRDPTVAGLLQIHADRTKGCVPPWGEGSILYHHAMHYIDACVYDYESWATDAIEQRAKNNGR